MRVYADEQALLEKLSKRVAEEYTDQPRLESGKRLAGGERNDVFKMEGEGQKRVLRIAHQSTDIRGLRFINNWSRFAADRMPEVSAPYLTRSGETFFTEGELLVSLCPYMEGEHSRRDYLPHRLDMARKHAQLHRIGLEYPDMTPRPDATSMLELNMDHNGLFDWENVKKMLENGGKTMFEDPNHQNEHDQRCIAGLYAHRQTILEGRREMEEWINNTRSRKASLQYAPVHGDLYPANVLAQGDRITGIIDWDVCNVECLAYEFGRGLWEYTKDIEKFTFDREAVNQYSTAYAEAGGPVPEKDWDIIAPSIRLLKWADVMLYLNNTIIGDVWSPDYGYESIQVFENLKDYKLF